MSCTTRDSGCPGKFAAWYQEQEAEKKVTLLQVLAYDMHFIADLRIADATGDATEHELHLGMRR